MLYPTELRGPAWPPRRAWWPPMTRILPTHRHVAGEQHRPEPELIVAEVNDNCDETVRATKANRLSGDRPGCPTLQAPVVAVAQSVRAPGCGPGGRGFDSPRSPHPATGFSLSAGRLHEQRVLPPTVGCRLGRAPLAQLAEQRTLNPQVLGSSPRGRTTDRGPVRPAPRRVRAPTWRCGARSATEG
jgi:hypothetical protein